RDVSAYAPILREADVVYHLACLGVRHSVHSPLDNHDVNATGTLQLLEASRAAGVPKFVYVSSSEVYGTAKWVPMTEDHPTFPSTVYGGSKLAGECYTRAFSRTYGYPTVVVRPFNTYGPRSHHEGDGGEVIPKFLLRCLAGKPMIIFGLGARDYSRGHDSHRRRPHHQPGKRVRADDQRPRQDRGRHRRLSRCARRVRRAATRRRARLRHVGIEAQHVAGSRLVELDGRIGT